VRTLNLNSLNSLNLLNLLIFMAEEKEKKEVPAKFKELIEKIEKMSVLDLAELVKVLEEKFGVSPQMPLAQVVAPAASSEAPKEQTVFNLELTEAGPNKISVIKVIREITQKGLKESKDLVDKAPQIVKEGLSKEEAESLKKKLEEAGAKVTLK